MVGTRYGDSFQGTITSTYFINGGAGNDTINGGNGDDLLSGDVTDYGSSTVFSYNGNTYLLSNFGSIEQAQTQAQSLGGNLVTINDGNEQNWLFNTFLFITFDGEELLWIGLTDQDQEADADGNKFTWINGDSSTYGNWNLGEPNGGEVENYVVMDLMNWRGEWSDTIPNQNLRGIIEIEASNDILNGGAGNDTFNGGVGSDGCDL
jgi:Ca2+-binding RTX toxin-like protein